MDGKQARNTGSDSPLGLLFDHSADAINGVLVTLSIPALVQVGPTWAFALFHASLTSGFFYASLEQYCVGALNLPIINGVSDGCVIMIVIEVASAFLGILNCNARIGCEMWKTNVLPGFSRGHLIMSLMYVAIVPTLLLKYERRITER